MHALIDAFGMVNLAVSMVLNIMQLRAMRKKVPSQK